MSYDDAWLDAHETAKKRIRRERLINSIGIVLAAVLVGYVLWTAVIAIVEAAW